MRFNQIEVGTELLTFAPAAVRPPLLGWYLAQGRELPWRKRWREFGDPYHVWVSEIMLQQTVIKAVLPVYERFLTQFPDVETLARASTEQVRQAVRGLGYYRRFQLLHTAAQKLQSEGGGWPTTAEDWRTLPGVGVYTAAAVASIAFNAPVAVVDGNVERVLCRLFDIQRPPNDPALKPTFSKLAHALLDSQQPGNWNQAMMELGQVLCTPVAPLCSACPVSAWCLAKQRSTQAVAPAAKLRHAPPVKVRMQLYVCVRREARRGLQVALWTRPAQAKFLRGTTGFITKMVLASGQCQVDGQAAGEDLGMAWEALSQAQRVGSIRHSITHHRIEGDVFLLTLEPGVRASFGAQTPAWTAVDAVEEQLVSNLDRKAWSLATEVLRKPELLTASINKRRKAETRIQYLDKAKNALLKAADNATQTRMTHGLKTSINGIH